MRVKSAGKQSLSQATSFCLPLCEAVVEKEVRERVVEVRVVGADAVVLVRVRVLTEQDVGLLQRSTVSIALD